MLTLTFAILLHAGLSAAYHVPLSPDHHEPLPPKSYCKIFPKTVSQRQCHTGPSTCTTEDVVVGQAVIGYEEPACTYRHYMDHEVVKHANGSAHAVPVNRTIKSCVSGAPIFEDVWRTMENACWPGREVCENVTAEVPFTVCEEDAGPDCKFVTRRWASRQYCRYTPSNNCTTEEVVVGQIFTGHVKDACTDHEVVAQAANNVKHTVMTCVTGEPILEDVTMTETKCEPEVEVCSNWPEETAEIVCEGAAAEEA